MAEVTPITIGDVKIYKWNFDSSPIENYKAAMLADLAVTNKQRLALRDAFTRAESGYGARVVNGQVVLNTIDFEIWIKQNINDDSMVCLGDKIVREAKRMYGQLEGNIKLLFSNPAAAYDKLEDGVKDAGRWIDNEILQGLDEFFGSPISGLQDALDKAFDSPTIISTYLSNELGFGKENEVLATLLAFKDSFVLSDEKRARQLELYYRSAKCIIKKVLRNKPDNQKYFYEKMVLGTYALIKDGKNQEAYDNYAHYIFEMVKLYE